MGFFLCGIQCWRCFLQLIVSVSEVLLNTTKGADAYPRESGISITAGAASDIRIALASISADCGFWGHRSSQP